MAAVQKALEYYKTMLTARLYDQIELAAVRRGEAWFHTSSAGHESNVVLNTTLQDQDWLHCHYRDRALLLARGVPSQEFFNTLFCNAESSSAGRQMNPLTSYRAKNVMSMVIPVGNGALQSVGVAAALKHNSDNPIVVCSMGDGTSQQGECLEAVAEAVRSDLPVLFFIQDNELAVSTRTKGQTFFSLPGSEPDEFYGLKIHRVDGRDVMAADEAIAPIVDEMRSSRKPAIILFKVERLDSHSNADDHKLYRDADELKQCTAAGDPLLRLQDYLLDNGISDEQLLDLKEKIVSKLTEEEDKAKRGVMPVTVSTAKAALPEELNNLCDDKVDGPLVKTTMREAINSVLRHHLSTNELVTLYGEDIEDPKGDVFGVTKALSAQFGQRVKNSPLTESTILGLSIGRALTGEKPVCFIQFADFLPHAFNQIVSELATMYWRSNGEWSAPVIIMVACAAYRPGLGPFHAQSMEALFAHTPGLDVFLPSNASDAAGLLNSAFLSDRPSIFFYPKSLLNLPNETAPENISNHFKSIGAANLLQSGDDLTLIAWGNTISLCSEVAETLADVGITTDILDIACLSPWDEKSVLASAEKTGRVIVVHEDNHTCGFGAEIVATIAEKSSRHIELRRITSPDTYLPFNFLNQLELLPSFDSILESATELLDISLTWETTQQSCENQTLVTAIGSGPSDETVEILEIPVTVGDNVKRGDPILVVEASKSIVEITSSCAGVITKIMVAEHDVVKVGESVIAITANDASDLPPAQAESVQRTPILKKKERQSVASQASTGPREHEIGLYGVAGVLGSRVVSNEEILANLTDDNEHSGEQIERLTGIRSRYWVNDNETALSLATTAAKNLLSDTNIDIRDVDLIICATTTPEKISPSMACQVLAELSGDQDHHIQAYDVSAACSGYLYALQSAYDYVYNKPQANILVLTAEMLSPLLNPADFDTYILFGDAATATLVCGSDLYSKAKCKLNRPVLSAKKDKNGSLSVPIKGSGFIEMEGRVVFSEAVRSMNKGLVGACEQQGISMDKLKTVVPHQASQRIMKAVQDRIKIDVYSDVKDVGNTSSSSIPLCLNDAINQCQRGDQLGICAFGAGFTYGAGILEVL